MGFISGFLGGATLTTAIFYVSLDLHQRNRLHQATLLRQQSALLNNIISPAGPPPLPTARTTTPGLADRIKTRWNAELSAVANKMLNFDIGRATREAEQGVARAWREVGKS
ncbi:hypothetical protein AAFC00_002573 [Neodothiora populina]|uniref:MICOS complex subunit MIC12 n=1 Tax=Neodothiora populina TaxID=2781224 RepID=A0ABR3P7N8_9PEZI